METNTEAGTDVVLRGKDFDEVCALLGADDTVKGIVHKKPPDGGRWAHCFSFRPDEYTEGELLDTIVAEYGPGDYPVQFKSPDDKGRQVIRWGRHMTVQQKRLSAQNAPPPAPPSNNSGIAAALDNNTRILASLVEKISAAPPSEKPKDTLDVARDLAALKDLFVPEKTSPMESIKEVLEVMALLQNNVGSNDDPLTLAMKSLLPAITEGANELKNREIARPANREMPATRATPAPEVLSAKQPAPVISPEQTEAMRINNAFVFFAENFLPAALQLAESGQEPKAVAEYLTNLVGDDPDLLDVVGRVIAEDDMIERLAKIEPAVIPHAEWFDSVADWIAHAQWPDTNPAPEAKSATIHATFDDISDSRVINSAETNDHDGAGPDDPDLVASGESTNDADVNPPRKGHDNDP